MKKGIAKFSKEFVNQLSGLKEWVGVELEFDMDNGETAMATLDKAKKEVCDFQLASSALSEITFGGSVFPSQVGPSPVINRNPEDREVGLTPELIIGCSDITVLQEFHMLVQLSNRVDLKEAYDKRKSELVEKETKEILTATEENIKHIARKISNNVKD